MYYVEHAVRLAMGTTVYWENCFYVTIIQVEIFCNLSIHECFSILTVLLWTPMVTSILAYISPLHMLLPCDSLLALFPGSDDDKK